MEPLTENMKEFAEWLLRNRKAAHLTQQELADRVECSKGYISQLERYQPHSGSGGAVRPSVEMVESFALALNADVNEARLAAGYAPSFTRSEHDDMLKASTETKTRFIDIPLDGPMTIFQNGEKITVELKPEDRALLEAHTALLEAFLEQSKRNSPTE